MYIYIMERNGKADYLLDILQHRRRKADYIIGILPNRSRQAGRLSIRHLSMTGTRDADYLSDILQRSTCSGWQAKYLLHIPRHRSRQAD